MNNIVAERTTSTSQAQNIVTYPLELHHHFDLVPIPLRLKSKVPLVRWSDESWKPSPVEIMAWASKPGVNWGVRCGEKLAVIDCDSEDEYFGFVTTHEIPQDCPVVKTGRGYHTWVKPKQPIRSQRVGSVEIKCLGSYVVAPPSVCQENQSNESKQTPNHSGEDDHMNKDADSESHTWRTEVVMEPIEQVTKQLEVEGWHILWKS